MKICSYLAAVILLPFGGVVNASAGCSALSAFKTLDYRYFVAGGTCAAISHGVTTPIDVIKTKIQANPQKYNKGMVNTAAEILKEGGPNALLGGLGPTVVGYGIEGTYSTNLRGRFAAFT
jgi:solute carrier family 25 phosphate transporter 3